MISWDVPSVAQLVCSPAADDLIGTLQGGMFNTLTWDILGLNHIEPTYHVLQVGC